VLVACGGTKAATSATTIKPARVATTTVAATSVAPTTTLPLTTTTTVLPTTTTTITTPAPTTVPTTAAPTPIVLPNGTAGPTYSPGAVLDGVTVQQICTAGYTKTVRDVTTAEKNAITPSTASPITAATSSTIW
jgi:hypothetical protein